MKYTSFIPKKVKAEDRKRSARFPTSAQEYLSQVLEAKGNNEVQEMLSELYAHWDIAMGEELYQLALPLGHRGKILLIAGEDNLVLNELSYMLEEILERVHGFMAMQYFEKIELHLLQNRRALNQEVEIYKAPEKVELIRPENLGKLNLPEGKVKEAYLHYLSLFK